jgi:putative ABC transport system permease protein
MYIFFKNFFRDLRRQPLRTILTLSGVIWGTFSIVLLLAFGKGLGGNNMKAMHGMGQGIIIIWPSRTTIPFRGFNKGRQVRVTPDDIQLLARNVKGIHMISPEFRQNMYVRYKKEEYNNTIRGVNSTFEWTRNTIPARGRFINDIDLAKKRRVCFLGNTLAEALFHDKDPLGKEIFIKGSPFMVVGVMIEKIQTSNYSGQRDQYCVFIPHTTYTAVFGEKYVNNIIIQPVDPARSEIMIREIRNYLGNLLGFAPEDQDAIFIWDFTDFEQSMSMFNVALDFFLGMIGLFTLLVGGVGVASIMMVVVEERTREIGIKLAVGAKRRKILFQFFMEALSIIFMGGLIGFSLALLVLKAIPIRLIEESVGIPEIDPFVGIFTVLALLLIGTISGIMPARRAASTNPIVALKK